MNQLILPFLYRPSAHNGQAAGATNQKSPADFDLVSCWNRLLDDFFPDRTDLKEYKLAWSSRRQKRTLASCNIRSKKVMVAKELKNPEHWHVLDALIYHEMCHAVLGYSIKNPQGRSSWHGKEFKALEARHPGIASLNQWIKAGGWRKAVRQDRGRFPVRRTKKAKRSNLIRRFAKMILKSW